MTNETRNRIRAYMEELPHMKEKVFGALLMLVVAATVVAASSYAWVTLSRAPEVSNITTTLASNGALEIALSNPGGTVPAEFDVDESLLNNPSVVVSNLQWGNLVNLSDPTYGIDNIALRPARLERTSLLTSPLSGAVYGEDGRITSLDSNYAYAKYNGNEFLTTDEYGVRAIATYKNVVSDSTRLEYEAKVSAVRAAQNAVYQAYSGVAPKFSALGTMISKYAQNKLDDGYTNLAPYIKDMVPLYRAVSDAMEMQMDAYVALANLQLYINEQGASAALTWDDLYRNRTQYNTASADKTSTNGYISLVGLTQFIKDYEQLQKDIEHLEAYQEAYETSGAAYYWAGSYVENGETKKDNSVSGYALSNIVAHLIDYSSMTIDLNNDGTETKVVSLSASQASALLSANGKERKVYAYNGILYRFEQNAVNADYRINGKAACTIKVTYMLTITVYGKAYTKASGPAYFEENVAASMAAELAPKDAVAEDTYGLAVDLWVRTNAETTCLTLEGATSTDEQGNIVSYDGVNRIWGATGEAVLTTDSTTQGGGSCYIYYADTPEDMARSLELLNAMKVAFISADGDLLATAEMDTANYWAVNGRVTVPLVLDNQTETTYVYVDSMNVEQVGRAVTTLYTDVPVRVTAIVYLDGTRLTNDHVLAAAEIQGSLNIQFGSSADLETMGSDELIDDVRTVSATVTPNVLDYDNATSDADMTTQITVNIDGQSIEPTNVTAFFVRAINSTQGTREPTMTFTKDGGKWVCNYKFTAPGIYYLRQVRLDGVDYTLAEPQKVEVKGFGLSSVTWSEGGNNVAIRTSEGTHSTSVTVKFAADDRSKLPTSVQARFVRDDGNTVNIPLIYNANGDWTGTGDFSASGVYQLQYLVADGRYIDLALNDGTYRTMDLSLGMYVTVDDLSGGLWEEYEEEKIYPKNVAVRIYNNAGAELAGLEGLVLYFGVSSADSISTDLTWDELNSCYNGTLPIAAPGRYQFLSVKMGGNYLKKCTESPVYTIISPDPPTYDVAKSGSTYTGENIQFVPLTNDAVIDGIFIENATSAVFATAVVYSTEADAYLPATMIFGNGAWYVQLPTYDGEQIGESLNGEPVYEQLQDGLWSLAAIRMWGCYDADTNFREESNPILWVASGEVGQNYLNSLDEAVTPDAVQNFSKLTTNVSAKVNVEMVTGTTAMGSTTTPFGTVFPVSGIGMNVKLTDGLGRIIPKSEIADITLELSYDNNDDLAYGYKVSGANKPYAIKLNAQPDAESGLFTVSSNDSWMYAGKYTVKKLTITIGSKELVYAPGNVGVPTQYTITTAAPTAENIKLDAESVKQTVTEFGGTSSNVTGTFLQAYDLTGTNVTIKLIGASGQEMNNAAIDDLSANLLLTHQTNSSQDKGGYTFTGDTGYQYLTLPMTATSGSNLYRAPGSQVLLAGIYKTQLQVTIGGTTETVNLNNITVWSKRPDVKITGISTTGEVTVNKNADPNTNHLVANADTFKARNQYGDYYAVVYMQYAVGADWNHSSGTACGGSNYAPAHVNNYANYTKPQITFTLTGAGANAASTMTISGNDEPVSWASGSTVATASIGKIASETINDGSHEYGSWSTTTCYYRCITEKATPLGSVSVNTIATTVGSATYTRTLANTLVISQPSQENPTLTFDGGTAVTIKVSDGTTTYSDTTNLPTMTSLRATVTANVGYHHPALAEPEGAYDWKLVDSNENEAVYTFKIAGNTTLSGSATPYPAITFSSINHATVAVTVGGDSITSGLGGKAGATVTVTVTADKENGFCVPRLAQPSGVTNWTANEGDFVSTYTFTMPGKAVSLAAPTTTSMYKLTWTEHTALAFYVSDSTGALSNGSYVVPGHTLTITLNATGGVNPTLTAPTDATLKSSSDFAAQYTYTMPTKALHLTATAESYPVVKLDNVSSAFVVSSDNVELTYAAGEGVSVKPGNTVKVVLSAKDGWYAPRMTQPTGTTNWKVVGTPDNRTATYSFTMPNADVDATGSITATAAPAVSFTVSNATLTMSYTDYAGAAHNNVPTGTKVQPGMTVTVSLAANNGYYAPRMTQPSGVTNWTVVSETDWAASYTFTMGTSAASLSASATAMPTLTLSPSNTTLSVSYVGYKDAGATATTGTIKVKPGTEVSGTVTAADTHYNPTVSGVTFTKNAEGTKYVSRTFAFTMPSSNVTLTASATANPTIKYVEDSGVSGTISIDGKTMSNGGTVAFRPGTVVVWGASYTGSNDRKTVFKKESDGSVLATYNSDSASQSGNYTMPEFNVTVTAQSSMGGCVTPDTLVTLADGTQKRIDALAGDELLLAWDFYNGRYTVTPVGAIVSHGYSKEKVTTLRFADGSEIKTMRSHGFYDVLENKFVILDENNVTEYIGHEFIKYDENGNRVTTVLVDFGIETTYSEVMTIVSAVHFNCFLNGILTLSPTDFPNSPAYLMPFEIGEGMKYDEAKMQADIETYGQYTYEEFKDYCTYEQFMGFAFANWKVAVGKGYLKWENIIYLIDNYVPN